MALRNILIFPHPSLRIKAKRVDRVDDSIRALIKDMFDTMYNAPGIGLAATQIDVHKQVIVMDVSEHKNQPKVFINPVLMLTEGEGESEEGCLSIPGFYEKVKRFEFVRVKATSEHGEEFEIEADGMLAVCIQHEIDHLFGKVFVDYISTLKRDRIRKKLRKPQRSN